MEIEEDWSASVMTDREGMGSMVAGSAIVILFTAGSLERWVAEPFELLAGLFGLHNGGKGKVVLFGGCDDSVREGGMAIGLVRSGLNGRWWSIGAMNKHYLPYICCGNLQGQ